MYGIMSLEFLRFRVAHQKPPENSYERNLSRTERVACAAIYRSGSIAALP